MPSINQRADSTYNYSKLIDFLLRYAKEKYNVDTIEEFSSQIIKEFLVQKIATCKPQYVNDLLKAFKVFFRYVRQELRLFATYVQTHLCPSAIEKRM